MKPQNGKHLSFPFRIGQDGRTETVKSLEEHIRDELVQLILTNHGERPFLVDFGGGVRRLIFESASDTTTAVTKATITEAIDKWLGHRVHLEYLETEIVDSTINVEIRYKLAGTEDSRVLKFRHNGV